MKKFLFFSVFVLAISVSFIYFTLSSMGIESLILCASEAGGSKIPTPICRYYLSDLTTSNDAKNLDSRAGLAFSFEIANQDERYKIINRLLYLGSDINSPSKIDGLTPINAAILLNDADLVKFLISKGVSLEKPDIANQLNPRQFLNLLKEKDPKTNRQAIDAIFNPVGA